MNTESKDAKMADQDKTVVNEHTCGGCANVFTCRGCFPPPTHEQARDAVALLSERHGGPRYTEARNLLRGYIDDQEAKFTPEPGEPVGGKAGAHVCEPGCSNHCVHCGDKMPDWMPAVGDMVTMRDELPFRPVRVAEALPGWRFLLADSDGGYRRECHVSNLEPAGGPPPVPAETAGELAQLKSIRSDLERELGAVHRDLDRVKEERDEAQSALTRAEGRVRELEAELQVWRDVGGERRTATIAEVAAENLRAQPPLAGSVVADDGGKVNFWDAARESGVPAVGTRWSVQADRTLLLTVTKRDGDAISISYDHGTGGVVTHKRFFECFRPHREPLASSVVADEATTGERRCPAECNGGNHPDPAQHSARCPKRTPLSPPTGEEGKAEQCDTTCGRRRCSLPKGHDGWHVLPGAKQLADEGKAERVDRPVMLGELVAALETSGNEAMKWLARELSPLESRAAKEGSDGR